MNFKKIKMFLQLFLNIKKNYFFEKYKFFSFQEKNKNLFFKLSYLFKTQVFIFCLILISQLLFKSDMLNMLVLALILLSLFLGMDAKDWRLFYRTNFVLAIPEVRDRFLLILFGNIILKLFIENNVMLLILLFVIYAHIPLITFPLIMVGYIAIYVSSLTIYFLLQNSTFRIKKLFSIINYVSSFIFSLFFMYFLVDFVLMVFITFAHNLNDKNIFLTFLNLGVEALVVWANFIANNIFVIGMICLTYVLFVIMLSVKTIKYLNITSYADGGYKKDIVKEFILGKFSEKIILKLTYKDADLIPLIQKEFALFHYIYKYNFNDYFFTCIADRAIAFLIAIFFVLFKFEYQGTYVLIFMIVSVFALMDINAGVGASLITNMSFITDYNALLTANTSGFDIKKLIKAKLRFYYGIKVVPYFLFFILSNAMFSVFHMPLLLIISGNMINLLIILVFPKLYLTNNLIYSRMNYRNYEKYLDESQILEVGIPDFHPLDVIFKFWTLLVFMSLACTTMFKNIVGMNILISIVITLMLFSILIVYLIMTRVHNNIINFIERGDYSADFAKIFKG